MKEVIIHTDGSCLKNPGPGGYCAIIQTDPDHTIEACQTISGGENNTTNNRMEIMAMIKGITILGEQKHKIIIRSDSMYLVNAINDWIHKWVMNDFKGKLNVDLWKEYLRLSKMHEIKGEWVKAHDGDLFNEKCDKIAGIESRKNTKPETVVKREYADRKAGSKNNFYKKPKKIEWMYASIPRERVAATTEKSVLFTISTDYKWFHPYSMCTRQMDGGYIIKFNSLWTFCVINKNGEYTKWYTEKFLNEFKLKVRKEDDAHKPQTKKSLPKRESSKNRKTYK